ncbi:MAG: tRNA preQ1(34) S-adenosylmethionine ribosyltransferase-isomerase QueA [Pseudomonadota bacterium]
MRTDDFDFHLPDHLIARYPTPKRSASRLLCLNRHSGNIRHQHFYELADLLCAGDLLVMNSSKVIPARVFGQKDSGGKVEMLIERILTTQSALVHLRASKALNPGRILLLGEAQTPFKVLGREGDLFIIEKQTLTETLLKWLHQYGHMPLPPYMHREDETQDLERYQTVYAQQEGSVAAPTAGLHFDDTLLETLRKKGVETATLTLHVGSGTFQPVRVDDIKDHIMHKEWFSLPQETCDAIHACKARGGRVIAVGTTTVRTLESAARNNPLLIKTEQDTDIFIYPSFSFQIVDAMITNFHLPKSTLLMLVSAFSSQKNIMNAYEEAIRENYRFYSYGDAMFIASQSQPC